MSQNKLFSVSALLLSCLAFAAPAATPDPVLQRQQLMKSFAPVTKDAMALRSAPDYDPVKAKAILKVYIDAAAKIPGLFPRSSRNSKTPNHASPNIWTDAAGFKKTSVKFGADAKAGLKATDTAQFADVFKNIVADCSSCHETYRVK